MQEDGTDRKRSGTAMNDSQFLSLASLSFPHLRFVRVPCGSIPMETRAYVS